MNDAHDNEQDDRAMHGKLVIGSLEEERARFLASDLGQPEAVIASWREAAAEHAREHAGHVATITPEEDGFLVSCPHGCNLGTSAHQPDQHGAEQRAELHLLATAPLGRTS